MKLLITDHPWPGTEIERKILEPYSVEIIDAPAEDEETLSRLAKDVDAIACCWAEVTAAVIQAARNCRVICRMGIGLDNIDITAATENGILVTNIPDYCVEEVADHAMGLLLALARNIGFYHLRTKQGEYDLPAGPTMHRLRGRTLGLIGFGRIAQGVFHRARSFGLEVVATSASGNDFGSGCRMVTLDELLRSSDMISVHAPLTAETENLLNADSFSRMKQGTLIVNTSRGGLIDPDALWNAIQSGQVAGAGLDVLEPEPPDLSLPLYRDERVIVTPHAAFVSEESVTELRQRVAGQVVAVLNGENPENIVNPDVLSS